MNGAGGSPKDRVALSIIKSVNTSSRSYRFEKRVHLSKDVWGVGTGRRTRAFKTTLGRHGI